MELLGRNPHPTTWYLKSFVSELFLFLWVLLRGQNMQPAPFLVPKHSRVPKAETKQTGRMARRAWIGFGPGFGVQAWRDLGKERGPGVVPGWGLVSRTRRSSRWSEGWKPRRGFQLGCKGSGTETGSGRCAGVRPRSNRGLDLRQEAGPGRDVGSRRMGPRPRGGVWG